MALLQQSYLLVALFVAACGEHMSMVLYTGPNHKFLIPNQPGNLCAAGATAMTTFYAAILLLPLADGMTLFFLNPCLTGTRALAAQSLAAFVWVNSLCACIIAW